MKAVTKYVAEDGQMFDTEQAAKDYEQYLVFRSGFVPYIMHQAGNRGVELSTVDARIIAQMVYECPYLLYVPTSPGKG